MSNSIQKSVFVLSDATGETALRVVRAALAQFNETPVKIEIRPGVLREDQVEEIIQEAKSSSGMIVYTLVVPSLRSFLVQRARENGVECVDLLGPLLLRFTDWLGQKPLSRPGLKRELEEDYFRRIMAVEFALEHDDGKRIDELDKADIVLVGVSRATKTPLSIYLGYRGWLVGNVPIILGIDPPDVLFQIPQWKIVALTVNPERLALIRSERVRKFQVRGDYIDLEEIKQELLFARQIFFKAGWPIIDMSYKSVEEAAQEILDLLQSRKPK
ncbi:MAG: kinase/pyrophosphorylase [Caldiserica bacterium]|jgi:regulator of PEP synthase PpsR (kinase-PPPase family)|nr:kinase/pyrophosphorylase [Caldisericota bacterium]MDH7562818.1 pyruvate, water dikinase regulatory protein [Caldisericota bacterium]